MKHLLVWCALFAAAAPAAAAERFNEEQAAAVMSSQKAVVEWLNLLDNAEYAGSYSGASAHLQSTVSRRQWVRMLEETRTPLGRPVNRAVKKAECRYTMDGLPHGEYVILTIHGSFERRPEAVETVTTVKDQQTGSWKIAGYSVK